MSQHTIRDGTLGRKLRELVLPNIGLTEAEFVPSQALPWHAHERASFCILLEGSYTETFRTGSHQLSPFDLTFKPHGAEHRDRYDQVGARCLIADLEPEWIKSIQQKGPISDTPCYFASGASRSLGYRLYREFSAPDEMSPLVVESIFLELFVACSRASKSTRIASPPRWLERVRDRLHSDFRERISIADLANFAEVHPVHLAQTFRRVYSCTIGEYLRNLRVTRAAEDILRSDRSLVQIAADCGFCDQSHLNRLFKKHLNTTPAEFRRQRGVTVPLSDGHLAT